MKARWFKALINLYPPYLGAGIRISRVSDDYREIRVQMRLRFYNRNYVGTHFGGSLYAMVDPFYMLMLMQVLGKAYIVWDKAARIDFRKPGRGTVNALFRLSDARLAEIRAQTAGGQKYLPEFTVDIRDETDELIARCFKTLYIKRKTSPGETSFISP